MSKIDKRFAKGASYDFDSMEYDEGQVNLSRVSAWRADHPVRISLLTSA